MDLTCNAKKPTKFFVLPVANKCSSVTMLLQAATIPARHLSCFFLSMKNAETIRRIGLYRTAFDSEQDIFPELSSSVVAMNTIAYTSSD